MVCALLKREIGLILKSVLRFIDRSVSRAMGFLFGCFRARDDRRGPHLVSHSSRPKLNEPVVSKNRLSSLFLAEEREDSLYYDRKNRFAGSPQINKELMDETKFLKASGTSPETPSEIRKASEKLKAAAPLAKDSESSDYHSWLPSSSIKNLQLDRQIDQLSTPVKLGKESGNSSGSSEHTPVSRISSVQNAGRISFSYVEGGEVGSPRTATDVLPKKKYVRFECNLDTSSSKGSSFENGGQNLSKFESQGDFSVTKPSPKLTPLKLSDEMQTPGTVFPTNVELANGKTRIRSQYVYPVRNPVENASQWKVRLEDDSSSFQVTSQLMESSEQLENSTPKSAGGKEASSVPELKVEASLSSWFKPRQSTCDNDDPNDRTASRKNFRFGKTPMDRPIIGMVAAHWNENEPSHISPKSWDGNGIPNSTNKYKEDQKVSWHATSFEERLEKALSEESSISQKKNINGRPIVFNEHDESDTALSKLQTSTHSMSVLSF
ncbi:protein JASON isoform X2 [Manihot esculenta]|uniref:Protein JASON n=2 Tax=Manihot esculenta TaxID=3983 RepID=A0A2C9WC68_MANES|nr:protein JASON isoform X2 [Manihot esculenta]OAY57337.1 hypothetical protein MANES_02G089300v8 [Manihot esculenta]